MSNFPFRLAGLALACDLAAAISLAPSSARGAGFAVYEQGVAAMANGGAFTARASDPSAVYFNPAALVDLDGVQVMMGTTGILLRGGEFTSEATGAHFDQEDNVTFPSFLYVTHRFGPRWAWGAGITFPSGLKTEWGPAFEGRFISREASLAVVNANLNVARVLGGGWAAAAGMGYARADVQELSRNIDLTPLGFPGSEGFSRMSGEGGEIGWNAALRLEDRSGIQWGLTYRSGMQPVLDGTIEFEDIPASIQPLFPNGEATASLPLPAVLATGIAYDWPAGWEGEFDVVWVGWSKFERLEIDLEKNTSSGGTPVVADVVQEEHWRNALSYRAGLARHLSGRHTLRLGGYLDKTPVPADHLRPRLPDADRFSIQVGYGYRAPSGLFVDVAYQGIVFEERRATGDPASRTNPVLPGEYGNYISRIGVSLGWRFQRASEHAR